MPAVNLAKVELIITETSGIFYYCFGGNTSKIIVLTN